MTEPASDSPPTSGGWLDPANYGPHSRQHLGHTWRYYMACGFLQPDDTVLDVACGVGYGSQILATVAWRVMAFDSDQSALEVAMERYRRWNVEYILLDLDRTDELPRADVAVSFETIEHLNNPPHFASLLHTCAHRLIIVSAPVVPTVGTNPHHRHDFTESSLRELLAVDPWTVWEEVRQGPYLVLVLYNRGFNGATVLG